MELIFIIIGICAWLFLKDSSGSGESINTPWTKSTSKHLKDSSGSGESINTSSAKSTSKHQFVITPGKWDEWDVSFNKEENIWVTHHHLRGDYNSIHIPTGIYLSKEHINVFFKGMEMFEGNDIDAYNQKEGGEFSQWISFLKKDKLFKDWNFCIAIGEEPMITDGTAYIQDFFFLNYCDPPSNYKISDSSFDIDKRIDLFIELAQKGMLATTFSDDIDIRYLTSDLEVLLYDDINDRCWQDYTGELAEVADVADVADDDPFVTDVQFSRQNIMLLMKLATETYIELGSSLNDRKFNEEKYFVHWLEKVKKISDFDTLWFPDKDKVIGRYYAPNDDKEVTSMGAEIFYNGKVVASLWTDLWGSNNYSPMLNVYHNWDELGPMEIDEVVDEFIEDYVGEDGVNGTILDDDLFYMSKPSNAPIKASTISI